MTDVAAIPGPLTILYDGECPFCVREMNWIRGKDDEGRLAFEDIAAESFDGARYGVRVADVHARFHVVRPDGNVITGMPGFRAVYGAVGLGWMLAPTGWPVLRHLFDAMYTVFARYRVPLGRLFGRKQCTADSCPRP